jgi:hypothetical protein
VTDTFSIETFTLILYDKIVLIVDSKVAKTCFDESAIQNQG